MRGLDRDAIVANGTGLIYDIVVGNDGPSDAVGVTVVDEIPAGVTPLVAVGDTWQCSLAQRIYTCRSDMELPAGATLPPISIKATVNPDAQGDITNTVTATSDSPGDPATATSTVQVREVVDLDVAHFGPNLLESGDT